MKENPNLIFTKSDTGNITVYLNIDEYREKMNILLNDKNTYIQVNKNPLKVLQNKTSKILKYLNEKQFLEAQFHNSLLTLTDTTIPKAYGLPKIHKTDAPLRPIISTINSSFLKSFIIL